MSSAILKEILSVRTTYRGLSSLDAAMRLKEYGPNARIAAKPSTWLRRLGGIFGEPMMLLLIATGVVYLFLGDTVDTIVIFISIIPIGVIEFIQESRTNQAIALLDSLMVDKCKAYRDGQLVIIESRWLVPGDLVFVAAGDKLPADGALVESAGLMVDESILTGEAVPAVKARVDASINDENKVFQGTMVTQGEGTVVITATGGQTAYGKLGGLLEKIKASKTPLQRKIEQLVRTVAVAAVAVAGLIGVILALRNGLLPGILGALTIAISIIPEEFPVVFSVFLIMGVWRLAKDKALVREMVMVETLGSATVICSDKTGTLTEGKMALKKIFHAGALYNANAATSPPITQFVQEALLALEQIATDPIEAELQRYGQSIGVIPAELYKEHVLKKDGFFDAATKLVHHTWVDPNAACHQYTAGAPEIIIHNSTLNAADKRAALAQYEALAGSGHRVIGIAKTPCSDTKVFALKGLQFRGLLALSDPPRPEVAAAMAVCREAGIRVVMITGDNAITAAAVAKDTGLSVDGVIEGAALESTTTAELQNIVRAHTIFARVKPEQKYLLVEALQANGEVVAMTGDGVNDAPALKKANIGIAMGQKGTEVARAAAGIVLLDDNFATIVKAVREGRRIYDNMRHAFGYLLAFHIPIIGLALIPLALGQPLFFLPIHIIFLELFCDPAVVLGFERDRLRHGIMREPPRRPEEPLIPRRLWGRIGFQGGTILLACLLVYYFFVSSGQAVGRSVAFFVLVLSQILLVLATHEWEQLKHNHVLAIILLYTTVILHAIIFVPPLCALFHLSPLNLVQYLTGAGVTLASIVIIKIVAKLGKK